jgi:hypothetical protein
MACSTQHCSPQAGQLPTSSPHLSSAALSSKAWLNAARSGGKSSFDCRSKLMLLLPLLPQQGCCEASCCRLGAAPQLLLHA